MHKFKAILISAGLLVCLGFFQNCAPPELAEFNSPNGQGFGGEAYEGRDIGVVGPGDGGHIPPGDGAAPHPGDGQIPPEKEYVCESQAAMDLGIQAVNFKKVSPSTHSYSFVFADGSSLSKSDIPVSGGLSIIELELTNGSLVGSSYFDSQENVLGLLVINEKGATGFVKAHCL